MDKKMNRLSFAVVALALLIGGLFLFKNNVGKDIGKTIEEQKGTNPQGGEAVGFPLKLPQGFTIGIFVKNLGSPRDLAFSPQGTLLVSIPKDGKIVVLPDRNSDGKADEVKDVLTKLNRPHGLAFFANKLYVVEETRVVRYIWDEATFIATVDKVLFDLPKGGNHVTRTIAFTQNGQMFISIGSTCDVCFEKHEWLAAVVISDKDGNNPRLFAKGLRNSVFIAINPTTDELWGTEMGRDFLGDNLPPDEINIIRDGRDYGWPLCYGNKIHDTNFDRGSKVSPCEATESSVYGIAAHSAPLGLAFIDSPQFPKEWKGDLLVAYHGSWNRSTPIGYKVVRLNVEGNRITGEEDFITGFLPANEKHNGPNSALGRPVDLAFDKEGSLYISDDKAGIVYKVIHQE